MDLDVSSGFFPMRECDAATRCFQVYRKIDICLGTATAVAPCAVFLDEGFHLLFEDFSGSLPECLLNCFLTVGLSLNQ